MLKMLKYELKGSFRQYMFGFAIYLLACITVPWLPESIIKNVAVVGVSLLMFGLMIVLAYNIIAYYQRSMFKRQGYLTLTLPVSENILVLSKLLSTLIWLMISVLILMIGFFIFTLSVGEISWSQLVEGLNVMFRFLSNYTSEVIQDIFSFLIGITASVMYVYFIITLVHTHWIRKHRAIAGIVLYLISAIVFSFVLEQLPFANEAWVPVAGSLTAIVIFYIGTVYLIKHHIELE